MTKIPTSRSEPGIGVLKDKIYVVGGTVYQEDGDGEHKTCVEVYDPSKNQWSSAASMNMVRVDPALLGANGKLYALGSVDSDEISHNSWEWYDPAEDKWTLMEHNLDGQVTHRSACIMKQYEVQLPYWERIRR